MHWLLLYEDSILCSNSVLTSLHSQDLFVANFIYCFFLFIYLVSAVTNPHIFCSL